MAHEISIRSNGMAEHAYVGEVGWTGLGNQLRAGATIADWQSAAGMDWIIERGIVRYATAHGQDAAEWATMPDRHVLMRSDTKTPLGIVSDSYNIVQPRAVLEFFRDLTEANGFVLDTAGVLFGGRRFWALAKIGKDSYIRDRADVYESYLLLCTSADGTLATEGRLVCRRVVCNNTLQMARGEKGGRNVRVSHRSVFNETYMKQNLGVVAESAFETTMAELRKLAETRMPEIDMMTQTIELLHPGTFDGGKPTVDGAKLAKLGRSTPVRTIAEMAMTGRGLIGGDMDGMQGTAYGWHNAVTQYVTHMAPTRADTDTARTENRFASALMGDGAKLKTRAHEMALAVANATPLASVPTPVAIAAPAMVAAPLATPVMAQDGGDILAGLLSRPLKLTGSRVA